LTLARDVRRQRPVQRGVPIREVIALPLLRWCRCCAVDVLASGVVWGALTGGASRAVVVVVHDIIHAIVLL
jgi:hypothetical protein